MPTFFSTAVAILRGRVQHSSSGHGQDHVILDDLLRAPGVLEAAVTHSIHDFVCTAVQGDMDEETRTASLMGHLASNINWYALVAHWTAALCPEPEADADRIRPCNLFWAQQSRHVESWRGADFGVAVRTGEDKLRIALYQAKRCDAKGNASLLREVKDAATANECLKDDTWKPDGMAIGSRAVASDGVKLTALHQVHKLEIWRRKGIELLSAELDTPAHDYAWCRYAFWHDVGPEPGAPGAKAPTSQSGKVLFDSVRDRLTHGHEKHSFATSNTGSDFGISLCFHDDEAIEVPSEFATKFLGNLHELNIPDFVVIDETGGGAVDLPFWQAVFRNSHSTVTHMAGSGMAAATPRPDVATIPQAPAPSPKPGRF